MSQERKSGFEFFNEHVNSEDSAVILLLIICFVISVAVGYFFESFTIFLLCCLGSFILCLDCLLGEIYKNYNTEERDTRLGQRVSELEDELNSVLDDSPSIQISADYLSKALETASYVSDEEESSLLALAGVVDNKLKKLGRQSVYSLASISEEQLRLNQIETLMKSYDIKMKRVREDKTLGKEEREEKLDYWRQLRDTEMDGLM